MSVTPLTIEEIVLQTGSIKAAFWRHDCERTGTEIMQPIPLACNYCGRTCHEVMRALWEALYPKDASTEVSSGAASGEDSVRDVLPAPDEERGVEISPTIGVSIRTKTEEATARAEARAEILGAAIALKAAANEYAQEVSNSGADIEDAYLSRLVPEFERVRRSVWWRVRAQAQTAEDEQEAAKRDSAV
jgi:hypothetical protein